VRLEDGETATPSALITFADDSGTEVTKTLNFTITGLNDAPFAASQTYYNPGGGGIKTIDLNSFLFAQDIDNGDSVHIQKVVLSPGSVPFSFFVSSDGIFTCDTNQFNSAPFSIFGRLAPSVDVTFEDTHGATTTKTFTFDVRGVDLSPALFLSSAMAEFFILLKAASALIRRLSYIKAKHSFWMAPVLQARRASPIKSGM
jgi:hypothetical protein